MVLYLSAELVLISSWVSIVPENGEYGCIKTDDTFLRTNLGITTLNVSENPWVLCYQPQMGVSHAEYMWEVCANTQIPEKSIDLGISYPAYTIDENRSSEN